MRTRRSPRNQERLWRELGGKVEKLQPITVIRTDAEIDAMFWLSKTSRNLLKRDAEKRRKRAVLQRLRFKSEGRDGERKRSLNEARLSTRREGEGR